MYVCMCMHICICQCTWFNVYGYGIVIFEYVMYVCVYVLL